MAGSARNRVSLAAVEMALVQTRKASFGDERMRREKKQPAISSIVVSFLDSDSRLSRECD